MASSVEQPITMSTAVLVATIAELQAERAEMAAKVIALEESLTGLAHENALLKRQGGCGPGHATSRTFLRCVAA